MGPHLRRHLQAQRAVGQGHNPAAEKGSQSDGSQAQDADPHHGHIFTRLKKRFAITVGAQGVEVGVDGVFGINPFRDFDDAGRLLGDVL